MQMASSCANPVRAALSSTPGQLGGRLSRDSCGERFAMNVISILFRLHSKFMLNVLKQGAWEEN